MPARKEATKSRSRAAKKTTSKRAATEDDAREISEETSAVVRKAADVFENEFSGGVEEARRLQKVFTERETLEPGDLDELAERVRRNAHLLIDAVTQRIDDLRQDDVRDLTDRFTKDAHQVLDAFVDLADLAPRFVNSAMETVKSISPEKILKDQPSDKTK